MSQTTVDKYFLLILLADGLVWLKSSYGKFSGGDFVAGLPATFGKFASKNPYPRFKDFLTSTAIPNYQVFGNLVLWGELFVAVAIVGLTALLLFGVKLNKPWLILLKLGLLGGAFLNLIFFLASGWTSPSTESLNLLMLAVQAVGLVWVMRSSF